MKYLKTKSYKLRLFAGALLLVLFAQAFVPLLTRHSSAATLTQTFVRFDRMKQSTGGAGDVFTSGTVCAKPATVGTEADVKVSFPSGMTVGTAANWTTTTTNLSWPTGGTAWLGIGTATNVTGQVVTFPSTDLTVGTLYCFNWNNTTAALKTNTAVANDQSGTITTEATGPSTIDTGTFATATVSNDQVTVTATVNPSFQMSFSGGTTDALGTLTTGAVASNSAVTFSVNTNAKNGWMAWAKDLNTGLNSASAAYTIASSGVGSASAALVAGTEGYNLGITYAQTSGSCTAGTAVNTNFDKAGASNKGGGLDTTLRTLLTCNGTTNAGVVTPTNFAAINGATAAATDYTDTETFVAAGLF